MILSKLLYATAKVVEDKFVFGAAGKLMLEGATTFVNLRLDDPEDVHQQLTQLAHVLRRIFTRSPYCTDSRAYNESAIEASLFGMLVLAELDPMSQQWIKHESTPTLEFNTFSNRLDICSVKDPAKQLLIETKFNQKTSYSGLCAILSKGYIGRILPETDLMRELKTDVLNIEFNGETRSREKHGIDQLPLSENNNILLMGVNLQQDRDLTRVYIDYLINTMNLRRVKQATAF